MAIHNEYHNLSFVKQRLILKNEKNEGERNFNLGTGQDLYQRV
jgi:hypothetical protein